MDNDLINQEIICTICPSGCHLHVNITGNSEISVVGNGCKRGINYGITEFTNPVRNVTTSIWTEGANSILLSVKTTAPIPKSKIFPILHELKNVRVVAPVKIEQIIVSNICDTGINIVATRDIK